MTTADSTTQLTDSERSQLCPVCIQPAGAPFRRYDETGRVMYGCVARFHDGHLTVPSESASWHGRKAAQRIRKALAVAV